MSASSFSIRPLAGLFAPLIPMGLGVGILAPSEASAQDPGDEPPPVRVTRMILDSGSGEPVSLAEVRLLVRPEGGLETVTTRDGRFGFEAVPPWVPELPVVVQ